MSRPMRPIYALGFRWDRPVVPGDVPVRPVDHGGDRLRQMLPAVWDADPSIKLSGADNFG